MRNNSNMPTYAEYRISWMKWWLELWENLEEKLKDGWYKENESEEKRT